MMSGPFLTGYTQTINDYYDREIDAINEPYRPIPSGEHARPHGRSHGSSCRACAWW
jgi:4-hydroxybenzoate polyprenyltransferase